MNIDRRTLIRGAATALGLAATPALAGAAALPAMTVTKSPTCGCCTAWADLARKAGYPVTTRDVEDLDAVKERLGVPGHLWACHSVEVDGYVVEGHVPFPAVARLLAERPDIAGISAPGMPMGSPGMVWDPTARYDVIAFGGAAGAGEVFFRAGAEG